MSFIIRNTTGSSVAINDMGLTLGIPAAEVRDITTVADIAGSLNNTFFLLDSVPTKYYVWYDVSGGGVDPAGAVDTGGRTGISVAITTGDTAAAVATATRAAIGAVADFSTGGAGAVVTVTNADVGDVRDARDSTAAATGFAFATPSTQGAGTADLTLEGASTIAGSTDLLDAIVAGSVVVLDPTDGTTALSAADSQTAILVANDSHFSGPAGFNFFEIFAGDTGSATPDIPGDTLTIAGGTSATTAVAGDTLTINVDDDFLRNTGDTLDSGTLTIASGATLAVATGAFATVADQPTGATDIANKAYVDSVAAGLDPKESVRAATTDILDNIGNGTWTEAGAGVGATLTAGATGTTTMDGTLLANGDRVLIKDEDGTGVNLDATNNGIYTVSAADAGSATIFTRATDQDGTPSSEVSGGNFTFVETGTANSDTGWLVVFDGELVIDTDGMIWTQFSGAGSIMAYNTITGDSGSATAASSTDTLNFTGVGITTSVVDGAPDTVTHTLDISDLTAGVGPLLLADEIAVNDGGTTLRFTFTDLVEDLDIPNAITVNGLVTRTAADTYASRSIAASVVAGDEGISVVNGDGVSGNPTIGVDITGQAASAGDLVAADEVLVFTGTNNEKMTGQQFSDGVLGVIGLAVTTINGEEVLTLIDTTRANKVLSVETSPIFFSESNMQANDWLEIDGANSALSGIICPLNATIVKITAHAANNTGSARNIDLYIDDVLDTASVVSFTGSPSGQEEFRNVTLNIDVTQDEKIQLRGDSSSGSIMDLIVWVWLKWRG